MRLPKRFGLSWHTLLGSWRPVAAKFKMAGTMYETDNIPVFADTVNLK